MMKLKLGVGVLTVLLWPTFAVAQPPERTIQPPRTLLTQDDLAQPEAAVRNFLDALVQGNLLVMWKYVLGAKPGQQLPVRYNEFGEHVTLKWVTADTLWYGEHAYVKVVLQLIHRDLDLIPPDADAAPLRTCPILLLRSEEGAWKIIPVAPEAIFETKNNLVLFMAGLLVHPDAETLLEEKATMDNALSSLLQIGLSARMFAQDHNNKLALSAKTYTEQLLPYLKTDVIFYLPGVRPLQKFSLNPNLENIDLRYIGENRASTILFYTGQNEQLEFPYQKQAAVLFVDGNAKLVTREEAKALRWKP